VWEILLVVRSGLPVILLPPSLLSINAVGNSCWGEQYYAQYALDGKGCFELFWTRKPQHNCDPNNRQSADIISGARHDLVVLYTG
jgi:hypothetical protein